MRGRARNELEFGSDSFLDVLCNIVGILVILIVVASLKIARAPARMAGTAAPAASVAAPAIPEVIPDPPVEVPAVALAAPVLSPEEFLGADACPPDIAAAILTAENERKRLESESQSLAGEIAALEASQRARVEGLSVNEQALNDAKSRLASTQGHLDGLRRNHDKVQAHCQALLADFETAKNSKTPVKEVKHRITPIGQAVNGEEWHFRVAEGRVAFVPVDALITRLKIQIERQKDWIFRYHKHEGVVGPVNDFSMRYVVTREVLTSADEIRGGPGAMRVGVSMWQIVPEDTLTGETAEQALQPRSRFQEALAAAPPRTPLTFWVYPESFAAFRKLQAACHEAGYIVSGRPLPTGQPIAGSPRGSRSVGQ